jgi:hypothetical protein
VRAVRRIPRRARPDWTRANGGDAVILGILFCSMLIFVAVVLVVAWPRTQPTDQPAEAPRITEIECRNFARHLEKHMRLVAVLEREQP